MTEVDVNLVTIYPFKGGKEHVVKMKVTSATGCRRSLKLTVTDKCTSEDWQSSFDTTYIENLTQKTGNYKQFDVFIAMLQSGLLKTSECVSLDLLTFEDLELLCTRRPVGSSWKASGNNTSNRRYLILTYTAEFDRIHYPLPLEYCGLPNPSILQATIRKLQAEIIRLQSVGPDISLQRRFQELKEVNRQIIEENHKLASRGKDIRRLLNAIKTLENNVVKERTAFQAQIQKLRSENAALSLKIHQLTETVNRRSRQSSPARTRRAACYSPQTRFSSYRHPENKSPSLSGISANSIKNRRSPCRTRLTLHRNTVKEIDFSNLESRIQTLQRMLKEGANLK